MTAAASPPSSADLLKRQQQHSSILSAGARRRISLSRCSTSPPPPSADCRRFKGPVSLSTFREEPYLDSGNRSGGGNGRIGSGGGGGRGGGGSGGDGQEDSGGIFPGGIFVRFLAGWSERVRADPQFPFKVLMEEIVGVGANVVGDMASRPNFGLDELDFVFCTMVVGSIVNFTLMYMLAPTSAADVAGRLPGIFAGCPPSHMFEAGAYSLPARAGTLVYKGAAFAAVGFAAGLVGTAISSALLAARRRLDPGFVQQNSPPPTLLNAATWAAHMAFSSNLRYQALNGVEFALQATLPPPLFKAAVAATRAANNLLGGYTFVALARATGSQKKAASTNKEEEAASSPSSAVPKVQMEELKVESSDPV